MIKSGFVHQKIINTLSKNGVEIETLKGNFLTSIIAKNIKFKTLFCADSIKINYTPISLLTRNIKNIHIFGSSIYLETKKEAVKPQRLAIKFQLPFSIEKANIYNGSFFNIPQVDGITDIFLSVSYNRKTGTIFLENGLFDIAIPIQKQQKIFKIKNIQGSVKMGEDFILMKDITIWAPFISASLNGIKSTDSLDFQINVSNFYLQEIDMGMKGNLSCLVNICIKNKKRTLSGNIVLRNGVYNNRLGNITGSFRLIAPQLLLVDIKDWNVGRGRLYGPCLIDLSEKPVSYNISLQAENFNVKEIASGSAYGGVDTDINGEIKIKGKGEKGECSVNIAGNINKIPIDELKSSFSYNGNQILEIDAKILQDKGTMDIKGNLNREEINLSLKTRNIDIEHLYKKGVGKLNMEIFLKGKPQNPSITGTFYIKDMKAGGISSEYISGNIDMSSIKLGQGEIGIELANLELYNNRFEKCKIDIMSLPEKLNYELSAQGKEMNFIIKGEKIGEEVRIYKFQLQKGKEVLLNKGNLEFSIQHSAFSIQRCILFMGDGFIEAKGGMKNKELNILVIGEGVSIAPFSNDKASGKISFALDYTGEIAKPVLVLDSKIKRFSYEDFRTDVLALSLLYKDKMLHIKDGKMVCKGEESYFKGCIPIGEPDKEMNIELILNNIDKGIFRRWRQVAELKKGRIDANVTIKGTIRNPEIEGEATLHTGEILLRPLNVILKNAELTLLFKGDTISIASFIARTKEGWLSAKGNICLSKELDLEIKAENLPYRGMDDMDIVLNMDLSITGTTKSPHIKGEIEIPKGLITTPFERREPANTENPVDFDISLSIPGELWVKNNLVNIELVGKPEIRKQGKDIFITGEVEVKRGYVYYLDKPFEVKTGTFTFANSPEINPAIAFNAETMAKMQDTTVTIKLDVTGTLSEPKFNLYSEPPYPLQDVLALLSASMTWSELAEEGLEYSAIGDRAVSYFLQKSILESLGQMGGLDMISLQTELLSKEKKASLNVGKYISKDLYVSYSQDLFARSKHEFEVEYKLFKRGSFVGKKTATETRAGIEYKFRY